MTEEDFLQYYDSLGEIEQHKINEIIIYFMYKDKFMKHKNEMEKHNKKYKKILNDDKTGKIINMAKIAYEIHKKYTEKQPTTP